DLLDSGRCGVDHGWFGADVGVSLNEIEIIEIAQNAGKFPVFWAICLSAHAAAPQKHRLHHFCTQKSMPSSFENQVHAFSITDKLNAGVLPVPSTPIPTSGQPAPIGHQSWESRSPVPVP